MEFKKNLAPIAYIAFVLLVSCTNSKVNEVQNNNLIPQTYVYECDSGYNFTARVGNKYAWLFLPDQTIKLPHVPSASGAKYSEYNKLFWSKGDIALIEIANEKHQDCINNRAKAIWEHAKLNGWDFRAVGNEPGWHILLSKAKGIVFVSDYGQTTTKFATPELLTNPAEKITKYHAQENGHNLELILEGKMCLDTMSDETFETFVVVTLDGKRFHGCGKALH